MNLYEMYENVKNTPKAQETMEKTLKIFDDLMMDIKEHHPDKYDEVNNELYIAINGYHFNEDMLDKAVHAMVNDDGSAAPKWSVAETSQVARNNGISFNTFNEYDWNYVMNMVYSDYSEILGSNVASYVKMANKFLKDKDAPEGKALRYYMAMKK